MSVWRSSLLSATAGQSLGRVATILTPVLVLLAHPADRETDSFFLMLSVSFYFAGTIANGLLDATLPLYKQYGYMPNGVRILGVATAIASAQFAAWRYFVPSSGIGYAISGALMTFSGIVAAFPSSVLFANGRYAAVGVSWLLRLIPLGLFVSVTDGDSSLAWLALGFGVADLARLALIARSSRQFAAIRSGQADLRSTRHYFSVVVGVMVSGLNPLADRFIAGLGGPGGISILDLGERIYQVFGALATVGFSPVAMVYLSDHGQGQDAFAAWRRLMLVTMIWSVGWALLGLLALALGEIWLTVDYLKLSREESQLAIECSRYLLLGLPPLLIGSVCVRQLIVSQSHVWLVVMAGVGLLANVVVSYVLFLAIGLAGIALGTSVAYLLTAAAMACIVLRNFWRASDTASHIS